MRHLRQMGLLTLLACGPAAPNPARVGTTHYTAEPSSVEATPTVPPPPKPWPGWDELLSSPIAYAGESRHGPEVRWGELRTEPAFAELYERWSRGMVAPAGVTVTLVLRADAAGPAEAVLLMHKAETGWNFQHLTPSGFPFATGAKAEREARLCQSCHSQATSDGLFGPARAP